MHIRPASLSTTKTVKTCHYHYPVVLTCGQGYYPLLRIWTSYLHADWLSLTTKLAHWLILSHEWHVEHAVEEIAVSLGELEISSTLFYRPLYSNLTTTTIISTQLFLFFFHFLYCLKMQHCLSLSSSMSWLSTGVSERDTLPFSFSSTVAGGTAQKPTRSDTFLSSFLSCAQSASRVFLVFQVNFILQ